MKKSDKNKAVAYKESAVKLSYVLAIIMIFLFCGDHILCTYWYPRFHIPFFSKLMKIFWFTILFAQQLILSRAHLCDRSGFKKLITGIVFTALTICAIPLGIVYFTSEKTFTLKNRITVWLMEKYPDDPKKVFSIMGIWALILLFILIVYLLLFIHDEIIRNAHLKMFTIFIISVGISFALTHIAVIMIPLTFIGIMLYMVGCVVLVIVAIVFIYVLVGLAPALKGLPKFIFEMMLDVGRCAADVKRQYNADIERQQEKYRGNMSMYENRIANDLEGYNRSLSDKRAQDADIAHNREMINYNKKAIADLEKKKKK